MFHKLLSLNLATCMSPGLSPRYEHLCSLETLLLATSIFYWLLLLFSYLKKMKNYIGSRNDTEKSEIAFCYVFIATNQPTNDTVCPSTFTHTNNQKAFRSIALEGWALGSEVPRAATGRTLPKVTWVSVAMEGKSQPQCYLWVALWLREITCFCTVWTCS